LRLHRRAGDAVLNAGRSLRVWLDDRREPEPGWVWVKTPEAAIELLEAGEVEEISLDHDLGYDEDGRERTGYEVVLWIEEAVALGGFKPPVMTVHTANPPGHERLLRAIEAIQRRLDDP
jgi:hypothetical protein